jgi:hypothetical protein
MAQQSTPSILLGIILGYASRLFGECMLGGP